jgi:hypothetical protein
VIRVVEIAFSTKSRIHLEEHMRRTIFLTALVISGVLAQSVDVSGRWTGEMQQKQQSGDVAHTALVFALKQTAGQVSGTAGPTEESGNAIKEARLEGDHLTFSVTAPGDHQGEKGPKWNFDLRVSGTRMEGRAEGAFGDRSLGFTDVVMTRLK